MKLEEVQCKLGTEKVKVVPKCCLQPTQFKRCQFANVCREDSFLHANCSNLLATKEMQGDFWCSTVHPQLHSADCQEPPANHLLPVRKYSCQCSLTSLWVCMKVALEISFTATVSTLLQFLTALSLNPCQTFLPISTNQYQTNVPLFYSILKFQSWRLM